MQKHGATGWLVNTGWSAGRWVILSLKLNFYLILQNLELTKFSHMSNCSYGHGSRIKLQYTRKIIDAIHSGSLLNTEYKKTEIFGLEIPTEVDGVPSEILDPVNTVSDPRAIYLFILSFDMVFSNIGVFFYRLQWSNKKAYKETLLKLAGLFKKNFETFTNHKIGKGNNNLTEEILAAGPNFWDNVVQNVCSVDGIVRMVEKKCSVDGIVRMVEKKCRLE